MEKIWKYIEGSNNCYISNYGEVKQIINGEEKMLHQFVDNKGYMRVTVRMCDENGKTIPGKSVRVHRLVGEAFIPKIEGKDIINHLSGNKQDNRVSNLEWTTTQGNTAHAIEHGLFEIKDGFNKKPIAAIDMVTHYGYLFDSVNEAAKFFDINTRSIAACLSGRNIQCNGVVFGEWDKNKEFIPPSAKEKRLKVANHIIKAKKSDYEVENKKQLSYITRSQNKDGYYVTDVEGQD